MVAAERQHARPTGNVRVAGVASHLPPTLACSETLEERLRAENPALAIPHGMIEKMTGVRSRRFVADDVNASDLAASAAEKLLCKSGIDRASVDLLVFASASQDLVEPATAHIVQHKLGTNAVVLDVKNACNSFLNALQVVHALVTCGQYRCALIAVGETPSRVIDWAPGDWATFKRSFLGYGLGDAGAAALVCAGGDGATVLHQRFQAMSGFWNATTVLAGGSMHPRGDTFTYLRGDGNLLRQGFLEMGPAIVHEALEATGTTFDDYRRFFVHQVSAAGLADFVGSTGIPFDRIEVTLDELGNMAAASLPVAYAAANDRGDLQRGDLVMFVGLGAGLSAGVVVLEL